MRSEKGITLVALVITIIVMLILVAVSVTVALNGGLFDTAKDAAQGTNNAAAAEKDLANGFVNINGGIYEINDFATNANPATIAR